MQARNRKGPHCCEPFGRYVCRPRELPGCRLIRPDDAPVSTRTAYLTGRLRARLIGVSLVPLGLALGFASLLVP